MFIATVPNRNSPPAILLRESYREGGKVKTRTLANLSKLPAEAIAVLRQVLKGKQMVSTDEAFEIVEDGSRAHGHAEAVHLETREPIGLDEVRKLLRAAPGVELVEGQGMIHATPVTHAAGKDPVYVSRLRKDLSHPNGIDMWVVADNIRKGAALNAVQIMQWLEQN